jgi:hypothetical protein
MYKMTFDGSKLVNSATIEFPVDSRLNLLYPVDIGKYHIMSIAPLPCTLPSVDVQDEFTTASMWFYHFNTQTVTCKDFTLSDTKFN